MRVVNTIRWPPLSSMTSVPLPWWLSWTRPASSGPNSLGDVIDRVLLALRRRKLAQAIEGFAKLFARHRFHREGGARIVEARGERKRCGGEAGFGELLGELLQIARDRLDYVHHQLLER